MPPSAPLDPLFRRAVAALDAGEVVVLERLIEEHPELVRERLERPGDWLRNVVGDALDGFFEKPFLLWFVAEDPVRNGRLPPNIAEVAGAIIRAAEREKVESLQKQLDYTLRLVAWSWIARQCDVQIALIDVLMDAGASPVAEANNALVNGNFAAAEHLVARGAELTLATALCLGRWTDVTRLAATATQEQRAFGFVLAALNGRAAALRRMLELGAEVNRPSGALYSHGRPLHHAVCSGSLDAVRVLVEAGAARDIKDTVWGATPLGWAEYYLAEGPGQRVDTQYEEIAAYLRGLDATNS